ncbi:MAG: hypothetical protein DRG78_21125 [Epsilonproteobacteria bacterium]|nr:MAG: hypothetical protein DRG78_21125 [Campylobacterota bacterium]
MKKTIINIIVILSILGTLIFYIRDASIKEDNYLMINNSINTIILLNKDFDLYLPNTLAYDNFDIIERKINSFKEQLVNIENNKIIKNIENETIATLVKQISYNINHKFDMMNRVKSYRAILNNSFRIIQKLEAKGISTSISKLYAIVMTIDKNPELDLEKELTHIEELKQLSQNKFDKYFVKHVKTILIYHQKLIITKDKLDTLKIDNQLEVLNTLYLEYLEQSRVKARTAIAVLLLLLIISIIIHIIYAYRLKVSHRTLSRFRKTVEHSDNIVVITDINENIKYVNDAFTKTTGYLPEEVIGQKPRILKSGNMSQEFYKNLYETIHSGKKWSGEFINKSKTGELSYEKASITPLLDDNGNIEEFIAIKLDITSETIIEQKLKQHNKEQEDILKQEIDKALKENTRQLEILQQQSKLAAMGEMIGAIAHQWRQPLNVVSTGIQNLKYDYEDGYLNDEKFVKEFIDKQKKTIKFMSNTIDDFRSFFRVDKEKKNFKIKHGIESVVSIYSSQLIDSGITLHISGEESIAFGFCSEFKQVILNLISNSKDALMENRVKNPYIDIEVQGNMVVLEDNAGGIPQDILDRVFEPYFTTKEQGKGTGMGLYMSKMIIEDNMGGRLSVKNINAGVKFIIDFSFKIDGGELNEKD